MFQPRMARFGSLDSYLIDGSDQSTPDCLVVLCHGYGAPGSDLVGVVSHWLQYLGDHAWKFRFLCPVAPHSLADLGVPGGRAWWPLNMAQMMEAIAANQFDELHHAEPDGLHEAREALADLVTTARSELAEQAGQSVDSIPLVLGGFSQGAMLTMDTSLRSRIDPPQLLIQFSGTVICESQWVASMHRLNQTKVYQSHGTVDPILPFKSAERLRDLLSQANINATFHSFYGPHTIDGEAIVSTAESMAELVLA